MKITKYGHACVVLEEQGEKMIIDPGGFTPEFGELDNVVAVVVTHVHPDHFNAGHLQKIFAKNPAAQLFTTEEVAGEFAKPNTTVAAAGENAVAGPFNLQFGGEMHELIHESLPQPHNTSVLVNDVFYYPGDSYTPPEKPVAVLAVPANAPWMKVADSMNYIAAVKPEQCFPTHNGLLSEHGLAVYNSALKKACEDNEVTFKYLEPEQSIEI